MQTGLYVHKLIYDPTSVSETNIAIEGFNLFYNFPNPFNPVTVIRYSLIENRFVNLKIFNLLGKEVKTLVNEKQNTGTHEVTFDGINLNSGIYFYSLSIHGIMVETKSMILIK